MHSRYKYWIKLIADTTSGDVLNCRVTESVHLDNYGRKHSGHQISEECLDKYQQSTIISST